MTETTIGVVQWEALKTGTDGEAIVLILPAFFEAHHVPYLETVLSSRLRDVFEGHPFSLELIPGERSSTSANYEPGEIALSGLTKPWPSARELRKALDDAFVEAGEIDVEQQRLAMELRVHLLHSQS